MYAVVHPPRVKILIVLSDGRIPLHTQGKAEQKRGSGTENSVKEKWRNSSDTSESPKIQLTCSTLITEQLVRV